jgi:HUS1 checkpoint protein
MKYEFSFPFIEPPLSSILEITAKVYIEGSMSGELVLRIESDGVSIRTYFNKMIPRFEDCKAHEGEAPAKCTLKVDSKKLLACLNWQSNLFIGRAVSSAVLCMVENEMLVLHVTLFPESVGFFTFYVPVHFLTECD